MDNCGGGAWARIRLTGGSKYFRSTGAWLRFGGYVERVSKIQSYNKIIANEVVSFFSISRRIRVLQQLYLIAKARPFFSKIIFV